jgi:hypothetical protein
MASTFWPRCAAALALTALSFTVAVAHGEGAPKERYYFELKAITPKPELKTDAVKMATARVLSELKKAFEHHSQIVAKLEGAPEPKLDPDGYRAYLDKSQITGAFAVTVELTDASETSTPLPDKPGAQEVEVRLALRMLGTRIPDDTLGFTGHGKASAKTEVQSKLTESQRQETWDQLAELAVERAIKTALEELTLAAQSKPKPKHKSQKSQAKPSVKTVPAAPH